MIGGVYDRRRQPHRLDAEGHPDPLVFMEAGPVTLFHSPSASQWVVPHDGLSVVADQDARGIANAYAAAGLEGVARLRQFAFVLWDGRERRLVAATDAASRAPLAFWSDGDGCVVCSRVLALLRHPRVPRDLDESYLVHATTSFDSPVPGVTPLRAVRRLAQGVALVGTEEGVRTVEFDGLRGLEEARHLDARELVDAFWQSVESAVSALDDGTSTCIALSGGIDSATVAVASMKRRSTLDAFSAVLGGQMAAGDDEERAAIAALAANTTTLRVHRIDCSTATEVPAPPIGLPRDDPPMIPLAFVPSLIRLWDEARRAGFRSVLDGDGGDELFGAFGSAWQAARRGDVVTAWRYVASRPSWRGEVLRGLFLPALPPTLRRAWLARWKKRRWRVPSWIRPDALEGRVFRVAMDECYESFVHRDLTTAIRTWLAAPFFIGSACTRRWLAARAGIATRSPLLDRGVIELALGASPRWMLDPEHDKPLLRRALAGRIPEAVRTRAKDTRAWDAMRARIVSSDGALTALREPVVRERLGHLVRFERVEGIVRELRSGREHDKLQVMQLESLVTYADWLAQASRAYGVT
jgi:asparagine synthase (glutamine-hydrolysing)